MHLSAFSLALIILLMLQCPCNLVNAFTVNNQNREGVYAINKVVQEAVEYTGWVNEPDYEKRMANIFTGELLYDLLDRVERFRSNDTDWYSLTFVSKCHIVYNNGKTAVVQALLKESDANTGDNIFGTGVFTLHNTENGWRITSMSLTWPDQQNRHDNE